MRKFDADPGCLTVGAAFTDSHSGALDLRMDLLRDTSVQAARLQPALH